mgnify:CR=1 FL=1
MWAELLNRILAIGDSLFGLSKEERIRKLKNELEKLKEERSEIIIHKWDKTKANRLRWLIDRISTLEQRLRNEI